MATIVGICNSALHKIGAARITALTDNSVEGRNCSDQYLKTKQAFLAGHPWNFAVKRAALAQVSTAPEFGYSYQYQLPTDCLRVLNMNGDGSLNWEVEGRLLLTDSDECKIRYISDVDEGVFSPHAAEALAAFLAYHLSFSLVQSEQVRASIEKMMNNQLAVARSFNGQESVGDRVYADNWLNSRY